MEIVEGAGVVVTGGGGGIGRAIARRLAADGARVVVNDLDPAAAEAVAAEIKGFAAPGDAGTEQGVAELIAAARGHLGEIDIYCSNAGPAAGPARRRPTTCGSAPGRSTRWRTSARRVSCCPAGWSAAGERSWSPRRRPAC